MSGLPLSIAALPPARGGRAKVLLALALAAAAGGLLAGPGLVQLGLFASGGTIAMTVLFLVLAGRLAARRRSRRAAEVGRIVAEDAAPCFTTDGEGAILYRNKAAEARFERGAAGTLAGTLGDIFAHPAAVLYRLQSRALRRGAAREDVVTRRGHLRLSVHRVDDDSFLWRLEEMLDRGLPGGSRGAEGLGLPMIVASRTGTILFMNEAVRRLVGGRPRTLDRIFTETNFRPGEAVIVAGAAGPVRALVAEVEGAGERREIYLLPAPPTGPRDAAVVEDDLPVALLRLGPGGAIRAANRRAREMLALSAEVPVSLPHLLDGPGRPLALWLDDIAEGRLPPRPEVMRLRRAAEDRYVQVVPWRAPDGAMSAVLTDATALKTLEAQFAQGQKMQAIGQLAGGIAHDFNNLLTAISGHCDLLLVSRDPTDPDYADLMQIRQNSNRAAALVSQLLGFSRKQPMLPERLELAELLGDVTHLLRRLVGEKVTLELAPSADPGVVRADRRQIEQILINLVVNARDAMPDGGPIRIATARRTLFMPLHCGRATVPPGDYALISVTDQGHGIPHDLQERIFEPFYTTKKAGEGTGLGLATVYGIVKQSGGFIFVDSEPGRGSTFTLWLPLHETAPVEQVDHNAVSWIIPQIVSDPHRMIGAGGGSGAWRPGPRQLLWPEPVAAGASDAPHDGPGAVPDGKQRESAALGTVAAGAAAHGGNAAVADSLPPRAMRADPSPGPTLEAVPRQTSPEGALQGAPGLPRTDDSLSNGCKSSEDAGAEGLGDAAPGPAATDADEASLSNLDAHTFCAGTGDPPPDAGFDSGQPDDPGSSLHDAGGGSPKVGAGSRLLIPDDDNRRGRHDGAVQRREVPGDLGAPTGVLVENSATPPRAEPPPSWAYPSDPLPPIGASDTLPEPGATGVIAGQADTTSSATDPRLRTGAPVSLPEPCSTGTSDGEPDAWTAPAGPEAPPTEATLPEAGLDRAAVGSGPPLTRRGAGVVLLVEDEAPVRTFASRALRLRGFTVIEAGSAEDALEALADPALAVDVFVTDVTMPGMDGPTWVRQALEDRPGVRVVFVSGYAEESLPRGRGAIPDSVFLSKPFSLDELTRTVQRQLH